MLIDPADLKGSDAYRLMISVIVPRPIAWTSTMSADGVLNAAPFSYFQALSSRPPMIMIAVGQRRGGTLKDTRANIEATGEFVVNVVSEDSAAAMVKCSIDHPPEVSEFDTVGLTPVASVKVKPPRIAESAVAMECRLDRVLEIGSSGICIGEVVLFHVDDDVLNEDHTVDPLRLRPLGRMGGSSYLPLREVLEITQDGTAETTASEMLGFWIDLRQHTIRVVRRLQDDHLTRVLGEGGETVGRLVRHIAGSTAWMRLLLEGREDGDEHKAWDPSWTPEKLAAELEADQREFEAAIRVSRPEARELLRSAIRHEAWHQGQIAAALRDAFEPWELWKL
jgi:flavin reductase (DIM6/NTAB) family NADH-FMN oxidoreductase RutF/uncharacterized damage-inducible protein DinB